MNRFVIDGNCQRKTVCRKTGLAEAGMLPVWTTRERHIAALPDTHAAKVHAGHAAWA